jgi:radical SAM protein with 4Fe4S-binding SPASM domain
VAIRRQIREEEGRKNGPLAERSLDTQPCGAAQGIHIEPNGELRPCTMLEFDIGHALRDGVRVAREHNDRGDTLRKLTWRDLHGCRDCALRHCCTRCYAAALAERGDAMGPYAGGCRSARLEYEIALGRAPHVIATAGRNPDIGPYREIASGVFEPFDDLVAPHDDELAARLGWSRKEVSSAAPPNIVAGRPGELVQIRRPGRKRASLERLPGGQPHSHDEGCVPTTPATTNFAPGV